MRRLWALLRDEFERRPVADEALVGERPPAWLCSDAFVDAVEACDVALHGVGAVARAMELVRTLRRVREHLDARRDAADAAGATSAGAADVAPEPCQPMAPPEMGAHRIAALARLCYGEALEALAGLAARRICAPTEVPCSGAQQREMARLSFDAYCAALWTSAHADYLAALVELEPLAGAGADPEEALMPPHPELGSVPSAANAPDLIALYERAASPRACVKSAQAMLALLARATNAGSRGWESALATAAKDSEGVARVLAHVGSFAFTGLHPCVHPAARPGWEDRTLVGRACQLSASAANVRGLVAHSPGPMKEAMRLYLALLLAEDPATLDALAAAQQPPGQLSIPPRSAAPTALQAAMHAFLAAGASLLGDSLPAGTSLGERVTAHLTTEPRTRKKASARPAPKAVAGTTAPLAYCASWLGGRASASVSAGAGAGAGGADNGDGADADAGADASESAGAGAGAGASFAPTAVATASSVLAAAFRGAYLPLWIHAHVHGYRVARLDEPQYRAVHGRSPAHELLALLGEADTLRAQRAALATPDAPLLSLARACAAMGIGASTGAATEAGAATGGIARAAQAAEAALLRLPAREAAMVLVFARTSALRAQALAYNLGPRTRVVQLRALARRLLVDADAEAEPEADPEAIARALPAHATHLYCCTECRRIVNACQDGSGKDVSFNELGLAASMLRIDGSGLAGGHMRCAKRSSAALRTAVTLEDAARALEVESEPLPTSATTLPRDVRPATIAELPTRDGCTHTSDIAKMRRDIKNCMDQMPRATACGDVPLVRIPVLGRALRVFGDWYALCTLCGALARIHPDARFGAEPCCLRCDHAMLRGKEEARALAAAEPKVPTAKCRYCGRAEIANTGTKFRIVVAPTDAGGRNAAVPPPLRTVAYCPLHYRPWLHTAHTQLPINVIFAHISARARPIMGAGAGAGGDPHFGALDEESGSSRPPPPPRSRKAASTKLGALKRRRVKGPSTR